MLQALLLLLAAEPSSAEPSSAERHLELQLIPLTAQVNGVATEHLGTLGRVTFRFNPYLAVYVGGGGNWLNRPSLAMDGLRDLLIVIAVTVSGCRAVTALPDAGPRCPTTLSVGEVAGARGALAALGEGDHEVGIADGGCWVLTEHRTANGPRIWELFAVTSRGRRLRMHVEPGYRDADPELAARHLERPSEWVVGSAWTEYAETIRTCRDEADGGDVRCAGSAIH